MQFPAVCVSPPPHAQSNRGMWGTAEPRELTCAAEVSCRPRAWPGGEKALWCRCPSQACLGPMFLAPGKYLVWWEAGVEVTDQNKEIPR